MRDIFEAVKTPWATAGGRLLSAVLTVAGILALMNSLDARSVLTSGLDWIQRLGPWGPVFFVLLYILAAVFLLPAFVLTLGAGAVFGVVWGTALVSLAATLGATAAFFVGRHLARDWVAKRIERQPAFKSIDDAVAREGWKIVGLIRLSPAFPFVLLNYAFALTRVSPRHYILATWIGMTPGILMYVYLGSLAGSLVAVGAGQRALTPAEWTFYIFGLLTTIAVTVYITQMSRKALRNRLGK